MVAFLFHIESTERDGKMELKYINGIAVSDAIGFVWDGCHKIYLVFSDSDIEKAKSYGYDEVYPMSKIYKVFRDSCPLRFIQTFGECYDIVPQCAKKVVFEYDNGKKRQIKC